MLERWTISIVNVPMQTFLKSGQFSSLYEIEECVYYEDYKFLKAGAENFPDWDDEEERKLDELRDDREREIMKDRDDKYAEYSIQKTETNLIMDKLNHQIQHNSVSLLSKLPKEQQKKDCEVIRL
jgi:uncharacterized protein YaaW (UPF0174 family)